MRKFAYILSLMLLTTITAGAQGFDWQYSPRLPFRYPYLFGGIVGGMDYERHNTSLNLSENNYECCQFEAGSGFGSTIGLKGELWLQGVWGVSMQLSYLTRRGNFTADGYSLPFTVFDSQGKIIGHDTATFQNTMKSSLSYITLEAGAKRRILGTHLFAGVGIELGYLVTQKYTHTEQVISPSYFKYNDGSQQRELDDYSVSNISKFLFIPKLIMGYDIAVGLGLYTTPFVSVGFPLHNIAQNGKWNTWSFSLGISILHSIVYQ